MSNSQLQNKQADNNSFNFPKFLVEIFIKSFFLSLVFSLTDFVFNRNYSVINFLVIGFLLAFWIMITEPALNYLEKQKWKLNFIQKLSLFIFIYFDLRFYNHSSNIGF